MVILSQYVEIASGFPFKSNLFINDSTEIPLVKGENLQPGYIDWEKSKYWPSIEYEELKKYHLLANDIVLAMDRPWVPAGLKWTYIKKDDPKALLVQRVARLRTKDDELLSQFYLRYIIGSPLFKSYIDTIITGINVPHISGKQIGNFKFELFDITEQKKIAAILSAYDDLINVNKKRIKVLEDTATELYKEWFVRFRFPHWEDTEFEKGVPTDWNEVSLDDLGKIVTGKTPSMTVSEYHDGKYPFYKTPDMHNKIFVFDTEDSLTEYGLSSQKSQIIEENSIMVTCIGTGGVIAISTKKGCTNQQINSISLYDEDLLYWAFFTIKRLKSQIELFGATGTTMTNLSKGKFSQLLVLEPTLRLIREYQNTVKPMFDQIKILSLYNSNLIKQKKNLLPRLMSGKISVDDLNVHYPPSMQTNNEAMNKK